MIKEPENIMVSVKPQVIMPDVHNPIKEWVDGIKGVLVDIGLMALIGIFLCCLIAPIFGKFIESRMIRPNGEYVGISMLPAVERKMRVVRFGLWMICLIGWAALILCGMFWKY